MVATKRTLTQADADFLQNQFGKVFATKDDLKSLATKDDIKDLPTKKDVENIVFDAIDKVVIPSIDGIYSRLTEELASKDDVKVLGMKIDSLDRKFTAQQNRLDRHNDRLEKLEGIHNIINP